MTRPTIRAIVVRSPYAQQIASGQKPVEYRSWRTHHRGLLAIVAARRPESGGDAGRAVCLVTLADCRPDPAGGFAGSWPTPSRCRPTGPS